LVGEEIKGTVRRLTCEGNNGNVFAGEKGTKATENLICQKKQVLLKRFSLSLNEGLTNR